MITSNGFHVDEIAGPPVKIQRLLPRTAPEKETDTLAMRFVSGEAPAQFSNPVASIMQLDGLFGRLKRLCDLAIEMDDIGILATHHIESAIWLFRAYGRTLRNEVLADNSRTHLMGVPQESFPILRVVFANPKSKRLACSIIDRNDALAEIERVISVLDTANRFEQEVAFF